MTTADFKAKLAAKMPRDNKPKPIVRVPSDRGYYYERKAKK